MVLRIDISIYFVFTIQQNQTSKRKFSQRTFLLNDRIFSVQKYRLVLRIAKVESFSLLSTLEGKIVRTFFKRTDYVQNKTTFCPNYQIALVIGNLHFTKNRVVYSKIIPAGFWFVCCHHPEIGTSHSGHSACGMISFRNNHTIAR